MQRRTLLVLLTSLAVCGCGGGLPSRLKTVGTPSGSGAIEFKVMNGSGAAINNLYLAPTAAVAAAGRDAVSAGDDVWGADRMTAALEENGEIAIPVAKPGTYDVKVVDRDARFQHIAGLKLKAGGRYVLELGNGGWRVP